jgi:hypothetical protein
MSAPKKITSHLQAGSTWKTERAFFYFTHEEDLIMADFLTELASRAGLEADQAHHGVGALLAMLKERLDPDAFAHLQNAIPNSGQILSGFEDKMHLTGGGVLAAVKSIAGKFLGGREQDSAAAMEEHFGKAGLSAEHLQSLLPKLHEMVANKLPPQVLDQIREHVPGFGATADAETQPA